MSHFNEANTVEAFVRNLLCGGVAHHAVNMEMLDGFADEEECHA